MNDPIDIDELRQPMLYGELEHGDMFYPVGLPHRRLMQHCLCDGTPFAVTTESMRLLPPFRKDVPCVRLVKLPEGAKK